MEDFSGTACTLKHILKHEPHLAEGLPRWLSGKYPICQCRRLALILGQEDALEKEFSSILAWTILWYSGGL